MIKIADPIIGSEEIAAVNQVLESGMLAQGPKVAELEESFAKYCGTQFAVAVNSGTAAIHAALHAAGIRDGDEVITTPYSFIATINPILMLGAKPVLVDIEPQSFNINPALVAKAITPKTKALLPVHLYGQPCDIDELIELAKPGNIKIIEDACQAIGAEYKGEKAGNLGDAACFSLYATKNIMSGEGGVVTTNNESFVTAMKQFRQHGMSAQYEYLDLGYNYRMTDLHAAIAVEQLKKADDFNAKRNENARLLNQGLSGIKGISLPATLDGRSHVYHQYTIRVHEDFPLTRDELAAKLKEQDIIAGIYYPKPLHFYKHIAALGYKEGDFPEAEKAAREVLSLPVHPKLTAEDITAIVEAIKGFANG